LQLFYCIPSSVTSKILANKPGCQDTNVNAHTPYNGVQAAVITQESMHKKQLATL